MNVEIIRLDDNGRGIGYIDDKIVFVSKAIPGDIVNIEITLDKKKYSEGKILSFVKESEKRKESVCPYFEKCGGCQFLDMSYENSFEYKCDNFKNKMSRNGFDFELECISNPQEFYYRNKLSLKVVNNKIGFYENDSNKLVEINHCFLASPEINEVIKKLDKLNIHTGYITIKSNDQKDVYLVINSKNKIDIDSFDKEGVAGIILNGEEVYGNMFFSNKVKDLVFEVSHDSFFQVNPFMTEKMFEIIEENVTEKDVVLDLYSGVGTLSLAASKKAKRVYGIEIVKNAVINAKNNALLNNINNVNFITGDLDKTVKVKDEVNTFIVDPPRSGLGAPVKDKIKELLPNKVIYVSCNPSTLIRDLKELEQLYEIEKAYLLDMFSYTYHIESICILKKNK